MVSIFSSLHMSFKRLFIFFPLIIGLLFNPISAYALYPSDPSSVDVLKDDLHGADLHNTEYVKYDLSNQDLGEANLQGAYMSCLLYTSPSPRDLSTSRMPSSA